MEELKSKLFIKNINVIKLLIIILFYISCGANKINSNISSVDLEVYGKNVGALKNDLLSEFENELNNKRIYKTNLKVPIIGGISIQFSNGDKEYYKITSSNIIYKDYVYWILESPILEKYWGLNEEKLLSFQ